MCMLATFPSGIQTMIAENIQARKRMCGHAYPDLELDPCCINLERSVQGSRVSLSPVLVSKTIDLTSNQLALLSPRIYMSASLVAGFACF